jgi:hypothetical protein
VPRKASDASSFARPMLLTTAGPSPASRADRGQHMRRLRQRTIEPVFGSLLQHYGLRRVNTRGRSSAHKTMLLTAIAFNLKKLLKHQPNQSDAWPSPCLNHYLSSSFCATTWGIPARLTN